MPSTYFPHVSIPELLSFAVSAAAAEHPLPSTSRGPSGKPPEKVTPEISSWEDVIWAGEKVCTNWEVWYRT